ncbi:hypothetical protein, partial [Acidiphilium sp. JA12-A1]
WKHIIRKRLALTEDFLSFGSIWLREENNHYVGLRHIYAAIYGGEHAEIDRKVQLRVPDFSEIDHFLEDELTICACLAYDELASLRGYGDAKPLYRSFGSPAAMTWLKRAARDELYHSLNARSILRKHHGHDLLAVTAVLREVVNSEHADPNAYKATFLFDHGEAPGDNPFSKDFLVQCANDICISLGITPAFEGQSDEHTTQ